jgi:hypothetical protein
MNVSFPYYGDVLDRLTREADVPLTEEIQAKARVTEAVRSASGVTDEQVDVEYGANPKPKGPLNWEWVQAILRAIDKHGGELSGIALEHFTRDVFL